MTKVTIVAVTQPRITGVDTAEEFIAYTARVSNPGNQQNKETSAKLLQYLVRNKHWSPFEMVTVTMEINTTRDIAHQIVRHRSFAFQEFSQRYANVDSMGTTVSEARLQDSKNRQASLETDNADLQFSWVAIQESVIDITTNAYNWAIDNGIAKEVARKVLPEGLTNTRLYMTGSLRSWIHYYQTRADVSTQKEHREVAVQAGDLLRKEFPSLML